MIDDLKIILIALKIKIIYTDNSNKKKIEAH